MQHYEPCSSTRSVITEFEKKQTKIIMRVLPVLSLLLVLFSDLSTESSQPVGHWTFENDEVFIDLAGNFGDIVLKGAAMENGQLDVGQDKWAHTNGTYHGPSISEKTMISWASIDSFSVQSGSILTIDELSIDQFDAIVFGEIGPNYWLAGSSNHLRTINPVPGYEETETDNMVQMAVSYEKVNGNQARIRLYRNGELIGDYTKGIIVVWDAADTEAAWGARHYDNNADAFYGSLDMHVEESRIYGEVLTSEDIRRIYPKTNKSSCSEDYNEGDVKLDTSTSPPLVMMCRQGKWGYICGSDNNPGSDRPWTKENIGVACQQLGYISEELYTPMPELDDQISVINPVHYHYLYCTGTEKRLIDCAHGDTDVHHGHCKVGSAFKYGAAACTTKPITCKPGEMKLEDNILKICSQGEWYSICGDQYMWTAAHAEVACRQLGLNPNGSIASSASISGGASNYTLDVSFSCIGNEWSLYECSASSTITKCANMAAVTCGEVEVIPSSSSIAVSTTTTSSVLSMSSPTSSSCPLATVTIRTVQKQMSTTAAVSSCTNSPDSERASSSGFFQDTNSFVVLVIGAVVGLVITALIYTLILVFVVAYSRKNKRKDSADYAHSDVKNPVYGTDEDKEPYI